MPSLSLVVIAKNEEEDLPSCLDSVKGLASELVVVDDGSTDRTAALARERGALVFQHPFESYAAQKQYALERATGEWVLSLDADERLTAELKDEIAAALAAQPSVNAYSLAFATDFQGRRLHFAGRGRERHVRLFRREGARYGSGLVHEGIAVLPPIGELRHKVVHRPYKDLDDYFQKFENYTTLAARQMKERGRRFRWYHRFVRPAEFIKRYILELGLLDGSAGLAWCRLAALYQHTKYQKLREMEYNCAKTETGGAA